MTYDEIIQELCSVIEVHKDKRFNVGEVNVVHMAHDCRNVMIEQHNRIRLLEHDLSVLPKRSN